jgi:NAD(P)-dependent dehydrogenase (short-subunit alcohol dehydrogenase family)
MRIDLHADLRGTTTVVTGGARGLGAEITRKMAGNGSIVWVIDVRERELKQLCRELENDDCDVRPLVADIRDADKVDDAITTVVQACGSVDVLVNNAAVDVTKPIEHLSAAEVDLVIGTNLIGSIHLCLAAYRQMVEQGTGHIINILSTAANRTWTEAGPYAASKTGLRAFTHTLFKEAQRDCMGIGVTGVLVGGMETPFILERFADADTSMLQDPAIVADTILSVLAVPVGSVIGELVIVPRNEPSWP